MNTDLAIIEPLNRWAINNVDLTVAIASNTVYLAITLSIIAFLYSVMRNASKPMSLLQSLRLLITEGFIKLVIPVGLASLASDVISHLFERPRPFAAHSNIEMVITQSSNGGMPSLLVTFTVALGVAVMFFSRKMGITIIVLAIAAGVGRIAAGIHYPSDIVVGALLGAGIAWGYKVIFRDIKRRASL